jgi:CRP-like cAMP-binding protein
MLTQVSERRMHQVRWVLTIAWLAIIASLFYDPWSAALTQPDHPWSPLRLNPAACVSVQGRCLTEQPYPLGTTLFWGAIVPSAIFILLVFGHELWRRICPLSFLSQIPRALGWQRQIRKVSANGKERRELVKIKPESWLGRNYSYLQFAWLFVGLCGRILFFNADRIVLAFWLLGTIAAAILVGYLYGGKSWCQYFCPMAPVQRVYGEPGGLFASKAHIDSNTITQSMCRTVLPDGKEQSACVACQNPCIDIDSERSYWDSLNKPEQSFLYYSYIGLVVGYFVYYYLYAGDWNYYFSGAWARIPDQLGDLFKPGFYIAGSPINVPKLLAVPLTLGLFSALGYWSGLQLEKWAKRRTRRQFPKISADLVRHRVFTLITYVVFNFFFIFGGRPLIQLLPIWVQYTYELGLVLLSTLWVYKTWRRSSELYSREGLASRFRKQLEKLKLNVGQFLEGKSIGELNVHEIYILAKVLPGFTQEKRHQAYKGVVREALEEGYVNYSSSLEVLKQLRRELDISDDEHRQVLEELGIEDPELLCPDRQRTLENTVRINGYRKALERLMNLQQKQGNIGVPPIQQLDQLLQIQAGEVRSLRRQYFITSQEEEWILTGMTPDTCNIRRADYLLSQLPDLIQRYRALNQPVLHEHSAALSLLRKTVHHKKELIVRSLLETLETLQDNTEAHRLAYALEQLSPQVLYELLDRENWRDRLPHSIFHLLGKPLEQILEQTLEQTLEQPLACALDTPQSSIVEHLEALLIDPNPLLQMTCLYAIAQLDPQKSKEWATQFRTAPHHPLLCEMATRLLELPSAPNLADFPPLERMVYLFNSDFFHRMHHETLIELAKLAQIKTYQADQIVTEEGDTCRELLLLVEGDAKVEVHLSDGQVRIDQLHPGQTLDELEILAHSTLKGTIIAESNPTRILAIPVDGFDDLLDRDREFARRVMELESRNLQGFIRSLQPA